MGQAVAAPVRTENVEAELHATHLVASPGAPLTLALRLKMRQGWHTYWRNPGDSGEATRIAWALPPGFAAGDILWPTPHAVPTGPLVNYGYEGEVLLPVEIAVPADAPEGLVRLEAKAFWLVCADVCIPEEAVLTLPLRIGPPQLDATWAARIGAAVEQAPQPAEARASLAAAEAGFALTAVVEKWRGEALRRPSFFPYASDMIDHAAPQAGRVVGEGVRLELAPQPNQLLGSAPLRGVLAVERRTSAGWVEEAVEITAAPGAPVVAAAAAGGVGALNMGSALGFAFLGGLILNLMPCVFPVLSIKALSFASAPAAEARSHGLLFLAGVLTTFLLLAGALLGLRSLGAEIGWGFQLQNPLVVGALALVFFALGLNLMGMFELGGGLQGVGAGLAGRGGGVGAFFTGTLAVVAASPCTAPFMGGALFYAATQPAAINLAIFAALGLGFALPFTLLSAAPQARAWLPKPGPWMGRFREALAFPMFATAIYMLWVLAQQAGADGAAAVAAAALGLAFAIWLSKGRGRIMRWGAAALGVLLVGGGLAAAARLAEPAGARLAATPPEAAAVAATETAPWSQAAQAAALAAGRPVFVNFTAAWCITCKANEITAISRPEVAAALRAANALYLKGDWTSQDPEIAAELARHGRISVPLYLMYNPAGGAPEVLPQTLDPDTLIEAVRRASPPRTAA